MAGRQLAETHVDSTTALPQELPLHERGRSTPNTPSGSPIPGSSNSPPHSVWKKSAADVFLETVTQPFLGFLTAFYRAHPAKRPFDARMVVPVDVIVYQDEHLITGTLLPMLGIDGFRLHAPEESLRGAVRRMTLLRFCKLASTVGLACFVGLVIDPITTDHAIRPSIPRRSMTPVPELRLDSLVPVPDHVVVGHVDEPVQRDAREAAFAE